MADGQTSLISALRNQGFEPHLTSLGGTGVGVLVRESATSDEKVESDEGNTAAAPKRAALRESNAEGLQTWSEGLGQWKYT
jgi:hypothetical protein